MPKNKSEAEIQAETSELKCPHCGNTNTEQIRHHEMTPTLCHIEMVDGELHVDASSYEHCCEESKDHCLFCGQCGSEFPIPENLKVEWV